MTCRTPGAVYRVHVSPSYVEVGVSLPFPVGLPEGEAEALQEALHDAVEAELARYF